jgi:hypothetical protein
MDGTSHPIFSNLDLAQDWIRQRLALDANQGGPSSPKPL